MERRTFHESCKVEDAQLHSEPGSHSLVISCHMIDVASAAGVIWFEPRIQPAVCKLCCVVGDRNSSIVPWYCHLLQCARACDSQLIQVQL